MKRNKIKFMAKSAVLAACVSVIGLGGYAASAYLTDAAKIVNAFQPGENSTHITEDFPTPTPILPGTDSVISKKVIITNEASSGNGVTCYIRAKIFYSTTDLGTYTVQGMDSGWVKGTDGYYYYTKAVEPGASTAPLMTSLKIDGNTYNSNFNTELKEIEINIYEESYQAKEPDTQKLLTWQEAWERALHKKITTK